MKNIIMFALGIIMGIIVLVLVGLQAKWIIYFVLGLLTVTFVLAYPDKYRLLTIIFILSLQVDVYLWLMHGHARSPGISIPLVVLTGSMLLLWFVITGRVSQFKIAGSLRGPIYMVFATIILSLLMTSERFVGFTNLLFHLELYFMYWLTYNLVQTQEDYRRIVVLLIFTLALQSIIYILQSYLGITFDLVGQVWEEGQVARPGGTVSTNPAGFTSFIMPALLISTAIVMSKEKYFSKLLILFIFIIGSVAIGLSYTRAAWIGYLLGLAIIVFYGLRSHRINSRVIVGIFLFASVAAVALYPSMMERVAFDYRHDAGQSTLDERIGLMKIAWNVISEHPLSGVGPGAYKHSYKSYMPDNYGSWVSRVHNEFILRAAETGVLGALAFIALIVTGFRVAIRLSRSKSSLISISALGWLGALVALVWQMNWVPWSGWSYNAMLWIMLGIMDGAQRLVKEENNRAFGYSY